MSEFRQKDSGDRFREETDRLLVRRLRAGLGIVLFSVTTFAVADLLSGRAGNWPLHLVQLAQLLSPAAALLAIRGPGGTARAQTVALATVYFLYVSTAGAAVLTGDTSTMALLFIVISMGTATLLSWGFRSQLSTVVVGAAAGVAALALAGGGFSAGLGYAMVAMVVAMVTSVAAAHQIDRHRTALLERNLALDEAQRLARVGSWEWRIPTNQVTWSGELYRIFGRTPEEFPATYEAFLEYVHPEDREAVRSTIRRALASHEPFETDHRIVRPDGVVRTLHGMGKVVVGSDGSPVRMFGTGQDVTERRQIEEALARARDEALEASALKSAFLANVSHEIRTPLNIIVGYNEVIAERLSELGDDSLQESQGGIQRACHRLLDTIHGILDFSRMEAGAFEVRAVRIDLGRSVEQVVNDVRPLTAKKALGLSFRNEAAGTIVRFDEYCLSSALLNLLQNAIKFTEKGSVSLRLHRLNDELRLEVRDTGIGIAPAFLSRLFEPFVQEDSAFNRQFEGSGLGLALTRRYLELNGASIDVESEKGRGTTFTIRFPAGCVIERSPALRSGESASRRAS